MLHVYRKITAVYKTIRREALTISIPWCWDWRIEGSCGWPSASLPWNGRMGQSTDRFPYVLNGSLAGFKWLRQANQPSSKSVTKIIEPATQSFQHKIQIISRKPSLCISMRKFCVKKIAVCKDPDIVLCKHIPSRWRK